MDVVFDNDITQKKLVDFCKETEEIFRIALNKLDKNASCHIHTSLDLGFPHDLIRISGGFPTGSFIEWESSIPFVPVDTTVNVCTASIFEISNSDYTFLNESYIEDVKKNIANSSFIFNFQRGNHFIILAESEITKKLYLILHSSASEFKKQYNGLYPAKGNWYYDDIQVVTNNKRYIRYISGDKAHLFSKIAKEIENYNALRHEFIAETILNNKIEIYASDHYHHYFMPDTSSVMIGSYLANENDIVPIFSNLGLPIYLFEVTKGTNNLINFRGKEKYLIPHGWGKKSNITPNIDIDWEQKLFSLNGVLQPINVDSSLRDHPNLKIRTYNTDPKDAEYYFEIAKPKINGKVVDTLTQIISYTKHGFSKWK